MRKWILCISIVIIVFLIGRTSYSYVKNKQKVLPTFAQTTLTKKYLIEKAGKIVDEADTLEEAIECAKQHKRSIAINTHNNEWVYSSLKPFMIITDTAIHDFQNFKEAVYYAKTNNYPQIFYKNNTKVIWENQNALPNIKLDVPVILQYPELPRGCEVTSLAMIMNYSGQKISKVELAEKIQKETTPYSRTGNRIYCGNPYKGFVGSIYNMSQFGYGVYHEPIAELARQYFGERVIDLTGVNFEEVEYFLKKGYPVWIITNSTFSPLDDSMFEIWHTSTGIVKITYKLHSVVITGTDDNNVYINDPFTSSKNNAHSKQQFIKAWEQMGNQAVIIINT